MKHTAHSFLMGCLIALVAFGLAAALALGLVRYQDDQPVVVLTTPPVPVTIKPHLAFAPGLSEPRIFARIDSVSGDVVVYSASGRPLTTMTLEAQGKLVTHGLRLDIDSRNVRALVNAQEGGK